MSERNNLITFDGDCWEEKPIEEKQMNKTLFQRGNHVKASRFYYFFNQHGQVNKINLQTFLSELVEDLNMN